MATQGELKYDVALSFAGEDRAVVTYIAECLRLRGVRVFLDDHERATLWGKDLQEHFVNVYMRWSRYAIIFVSLPYSTKIWPRHELRAALARAMAEKQEYILPVCIDDTELDGLLPTIGVRDLRKDTPAEICHLICEKLGVPSQRTKADRLPSPWSPVDAGRATFNYASHNGRYRIGVDPYVFETAWSKASDQSIYCLNDPPSIRGVALAPPGSTIESVTNASMLDFSSRIRQPRRGQVVVLENVSGFFAALRIIDIQDDTRGSPQDSLTFDYRILRDGSKDFSRPPSYEA